MHADRLRRPSSAVGDAGLRRGSIAFLTVGAVAALAGTMVPDPDASDHAGLLVVALVVAGLKRRLDAHVDGLRSRADTDPLTGVLNHGAFGAALDRAVDRFHATRCGATLLVLDLDHFKSVNDRFGHQEGDRMLRLVSRLLSQHRRREDAQGRIGGEEFALLLVDADARVAQRVAERIRAALRDATATAPVPLTLSVGIAALSPAFASSHALLHAADRALYAAKDSGRDRVVTVEGADTAAAAA